MTVKIGNKLYHSDKEPILIILSDDMKNNISNMPKDNYFYCEFPQGSNKNFIEKFMDVKEND